ncbi:1-acyl-sn-glycerol-3-phosphate acyltransferase [Coleophoma crateriformis]|uniref:1-acyl-sn-glycerol-3-phosphate acyltransferase n=1 Tax=Coleophoma crateriformis TaxID=565419 RepID=A0A3D8QTZ1_9HELO|nr:1-acyl-sn-glycerol-3-phosphate acyltransferase [Coleophoma crateriformis]
MSAFLHYSALFLEVYLGLTVALYMLSMRLSQAGFFARLLAAYASLVVCACYGVTVSIFFRLIGYPGLAQWATARSFKYVMQLTTGVTCEIEDPNDYLNTTRPAVFIGNHQSELDVLILGHIFPKYCSVTAKSSLKNMPFLGWFMRLSGSVFIDRANSKNARNAMEGAATHMKKDKQSVYMFPEGTRSYAKEPMLLPFKKGAFHLAVQAGVPIVPVVAANYSNLLYVPDRNFQSGVIHLKVLEPIPTKNLTAADVEDLTRDTRELMLREIISLTAKQQGKPIAMSAHQNGDGLVKASGAEATIS